MSVPWPLPAAAAVGESIRSIGPTVVGYWPVANMNPYQSLLYSRFSAQGIGVVPVSAMAEIEQLTVGPRLGAATALHIHWTAPVTDRAPDEASARIAVKEFIERLDVLTAAGVQLAWTVHNVLPHQARYRDLEMELRRALASRVGLIHVMSERTTEAAAGVFEIDPEKLVHVPHPEYRDSYPRQALGRARARLSLGLPQRGTVVASIGSINRYKGIDRLVDVIEQLAADDAVSGLVAGIPGTVESAREVVARAESSPNTTVVARKLSDRDVTMMHEAADLVALPYRASLNSGAAILALSFGVPVVAPDLPGFSDLVNEQTGVLYSNEEGLEKALGRAISMLDSGGFSANAIDEVLDARRPGDVSTRLAEGFSAKLFDG